MALLLGGVEGSTEAVVAAGIVDLGLVTEVLRGLRCASGDCGGEDSVVEVTAGASEALLLVRRRGLSLVRRLDCCD